MTETEGEREREREREIRYHAVHSTPIVLVALTSLNSLSTWGSKGGVFVCLCTHVLVGQWGKQYWRNTNIVVLRVVYLSSCYKCFVFWFARLSVFFACLYVCWRVILEGCFLGCLRGCFLGFDYFAH